MTNSDNAIQPPPPLIIDLIHSVVEKDDLYQGKMKEPRHAYNNSWELF